MIAVGGRDQNAPPLPGQLIDQNAWIDLVPMADGERKTIPGAAYPLGAPCNGFNEREIRLRSQTVMAGEKGHHFAGLFSIVLGGGRHAGGR